MPFRPHVPRWLVHPAATAVLLMIIALSFWRLPAWTPARDSLAARLRLDARGEARPTMHYRSDVLAVASGEKGRHVVDMADEGWSNIKFGPKQLSEFHLYDFMRTEQRRGLWALTRESRGMRLVSINEGFWSQPVDQDRELVVAHLLMTGEITARDARRLRDEDFVHSRVLWPGIIENTVVALAFLLAILSLGWLSPAWWRQRRGRYRLRRRHCPRCNYNLAGLGSSTCPECGEQLPTATSDTRGGTPNSTRS